MNKILSFVITLLFGALFGYCLIELATPPAFTDNPQDAQRESAQP